jgi:thiol-disulfide isomerase/thioredoxin
MGWLRSSRLLVVAIAALAAAAGVAIQSVLLDGAKPASSSETLLRASFNDLSGNAQNIAQWRGKVIVANFWATWCPPCLKEIPDFIEMQARYRAQGLQFVGIAIDQPEKVAAYMEKVEFNYPVLVGGLEAAEISRELGNRHGALPFTVVLDRSGKVNAVNVGSLDIARLSKMVDPLLVTP